MDIYEIGRQDLDGKRFVFRNFAEFFGEGFQNRAFIFDGFVLNVCMEGTAKLKIDYKEYMVMPNDLFAIFARACLFHQGLFTRF